MRLLLVANLDWYLYNYRLPLARAARARGYDVGMLGSNGAYLDRLRQEGFRCWSWELGRRVVGPGRAWRELQRLQEVLREAKPDLVHYFTTKPILYGGLVARARRREYAVVNAPTGLGPAFATPGTAAALTRAAIRRLYRNALNGPGVRNIFQNPDDLADLKDCGALRSDNHHLIRGSGVSIARFGGYPTPVNPNPQVLMATRVNVFKGVREFAYAARILRDRGCAAEFLLAGTPDRGNYNCIPEDEIQGWVDSGLIRYLGHISAIETQLAKADMAVLPTYNREGVPRILIEAAAMGKPLVATDVPGCREIVQHEKNGLLIPPRDPVALADAVARLAGDAALRSRMGAAGRQLVAEQFEEELVLSSTLEVYSRAAADQLRTSAA